MEKCIYECFALRGAKEALFQSNKSRQINPNMSRQIQTASVTTRFKRINSDRSIPILPIPMVLAIIPVGFNRINQDRSIPTFSGSHMAGIATGKFQSYQSKQINPDVAKRCRPARGEKYVSIVSIQTDQSRPCYKYKSGYLCRMFQSYQSRQINPDTGLPEPQPDTLFMFQSYQSRQINPDIAVADRKTRFKEMFQSYQSKQSKQINPDYKDKFRQDLKNLPFQSYQPKQINPD